MNSNNGVMRMAALILAFVPISMLAQAARADDSFDGVRHKVVSFRDLNLETPEGAATLYQRITSAAHEVCDNPMRYDLSGFKLHICIKDAVSRAVAQVNRPMLTSLYQAKTGKSDKKATTLAQAN